MPKTLTTPPSLLAPLIARAAGDALFILPDLRPITIGRIRAMAVHLADIADTLDADPVLHSKSAAICVATLLAAAISGRSIGLPASVKADYLAEIGLAERFVIGDDHISGTPLPRWDALPADADVCMDGAPADLAIDIFTSGSTSQPERIAKRLSQLEIEAANLDRLWGDKAGHVLATVSPLHIYGLLFRIAWPILSGRTGDDQAAAFWEQIVGRLGPGTTLVSSPAHLSRLPPIDFATTPPDQIFSSGQLLTAHDAAQCRAAFGIEVTEVLGNTLTGGVGWRRQGMDRDLWTPFPGVTLSIDEEQSLSVRSDYLPDAAAYPTGDRVMLRDGGRFTLLGRVDRMEKVNGKRVSLNRVEAAFEALPLVARTRALTLPDESGDLAAVIILTEAGRTALAMEGRFALSRRLRREAGSSLESHELPKHWRFEESFPRNSQGKEPIAALRALFHSPLLSLGDHHVTMADPNHAVIGLHIDPAWPWFRGHFDDLPVLPGVAQIHIAALLAKQIWGFWPRGGSLRRIKFLRIIEPGRDMRLELERDPAKGTLAMRWFFADGTPVSHGNIGGTV